jgi:hypothetical protein
MASVIMAVGWTALLLAVRVPVALQRDARRTVPTKTIIAETVV